MGYFQSGRQRPASRAATHITFRVGGQLYGVPLDMIVEVLALNRFSPLHTSDPAVVGEIELRGSALVVVDMGLRLRGTPVVPSAKSCVLIVRRGSARSGCFVDEARQLIRVPEDEIQLSGCLVEEACAAASIPQAEVNAPENASLSGESHGFPLYQAGGETTLLPPRELCYPK